MARGVYVGLGVAVSTIYLDPDCLQVLVKWYMMLSIRNIYICILLTGRGIHETLHTPKCRLTAEGALAGNSPLLKGVLWPGC